MTDLYLIAHIAGRAVAIVSDHVDSVVDIGEITPVPRAAPQVRGLAALRSRVVTVIDTRVALGLDRDQNAARAVIIRCEGQSYAFLVDALDDVSAFALQPLANGLALAPQWAGIALGLVEHGGEPLLAVDLSRLVPNTALAA